MTRFRLFSTLVVLAVGSGMAANYLQPDAPSAPEPIKAAGNRPAYEPNLTTPADLAPAVPTTTERAYTAPPPIVALPSGPLLRSATDAPPIDTTSLDPSLPVRHDPDASPGLSAETGAPLEPYPLDAQPTPIVRPAATRRPRPQPKTAQTDKKIEQLFISPLGVR